MQDVSFSLHLPEQVHDRLVAVKQQRAPEASWADFFELVCTELESNSDPDSILESKTPEQIKEYSKKRPWGTPIKDHPLFAEAIELVKKVPADERFTLLDFFGDRWDQVPSPRVFGRLFKQEVELKGLARHVDDDRAYGVAVYKRVKSLFA